MTIHLLGLTGSLRRASYSTAILRELQAEVGEGIRFDLASPDLPLYNEDDDGPDAPAPVQALRDAITAADGLVICTTEYNHGIPGVLKNALDWASRPSAKSSLKDKPSLIISNSPAFIGGVRAQAQLNETLLAAHAFILPGRQVVIGGINDKLRDGHFVDKANLSFALAATHKLADYCRRVRDGQGH